MSCGYKKSKKTERMYKDLIYRAQRRNILISQIADIKGQITDIEYKIQKTEYDLFSFDDTFSDSDEITLKKQELEKDLKKLNDFSTKFKSILKEFEKELEAVENI